MNASATHTETVPSRAVSPGEIEQVERALIDASARGPVLFFFTTAISWLLGSTAFGFIASIKLHHPEFLGEWNWLTYGRVWPAYLDMLAYGWASMAGIGTAVWLLARLCRVSLRRPALLIFGGVFWNIGVTIGVLSVLLGGNQGVEWLEFPRAASLVMFAGYALIGIWAAVAFDARRPGHTYISVWYLVGAIFWFPWAYGAACLLISTLHVHGVVQAAVAAWYVHNLLGLWFTAIGLAAVYYLIPKVVGQPIHSYSLASLGFWTFAIFQSWTGMVRYSGGPFPVWLVTVSIVATIMSLIPVATVTLNYALTMRGHYHMVYNSPTIRFTLFGAIAYTFANLLAILSATRSFDQVSHFTQFGNGQTQLCLYAFFSMVMFGAIYYITPRLVGCEWLSASMIRIHFWCAAYGGGFLVVALLLGGIVQGSSLLYVDPTVVKPEQFHSQFLEAMQAAQPWLIGCTVFWLLLILGHLIFSFHFMLMLLRFGRPAGDPTMLAPTEEVKTA